MIGFKVNANVYPDETYPKKTTDIYFNEFGEMEEEECEEISETFLSIGYIDFNFKDLDDLITLEFPYLSTFPIEFLFKFVDYFKKEIDNKLSNVDAVCIIEPLDNSYITKYKDNYLIKSFIMEYNVIKTIICPNYLNMMAEYLSNIIQPILIFEFKIKVQSRYFGGLDTKLIIYKYKIEEIEYFSFFLMNDPTFEEMDNHYDISYKEIKNIIEISFRNFIWKDKCELNYFLRQPVLEFFESINSYISDSNIILDPDESKKKKSRVLSDPFFKREILGWIFVV